jgi:hypothetical protein
MFGHRVACSNGLSDSKLNVSDTIIRTPNEDVQAIKFHENSHAKRINQTHSEDCRCNDQAVDWETGESWINSAQGT